MPVAPLTLRIPKGSPLTPLEMDNDLSILRDFSNSLEQLVLALFNPDGTLIANSVNTAAIQNRAVTLAKLAFRSIFFYVDTGLANAMVLTTTSGALPAYASGIAFWVVAAATNSGATTVNIDGLGSRAVKKIDPGGLVALTAGDIITSGVYLMVDDGVELVLLNPTLPINKLITQNVQTDTQFLNTRLGSAIYFPHGAGVSRPLSVRWVLVCTTNDNGFLSAGPNGADEISVESVLAYKAGADVDFDCPFTTQVDDVNVGISCIPASEITGLNVQNKTGTADADLTTTSWKLRVYIGTVT